ncbi:CsbD family protein [Mycolicibacterium sp. P1-18]|uniref:CsbD family protein n=1 Tax=Mycolicibacterium sp. P1-18 TaxID=2024615 RepID=UPI0011F12C86|nr:CsbD family protein [Mycolicibacterium sp. P1-18]KAA0098945.1 CsbD family protein [Mycolicibacterium sp. P1-18]
MAADDKAAEARKGLIDSVKGKAKEVVGSVTGNDSLTAEGQLEQTQASERKDANAAEAVADAEAAQAKARADDAAIRGEQQRIVAEADAASAQQAASRQQAAEKQAADQAANAEVARANDQAEARRKQDQMAADIKAGAEVDAASDDYVDALADHQESTADVAAKRDEADRLRARAHSDEGN